MRRIALRLCLASITASAVVGIVILLSAGEMGLTQGRILATTLVLSGASVLGMACAPALERRRLGWVPRAALVASVLAGVLGILSIWVENLRAEAWWKVVGSACTLACCGAHASLLALAEPSRRHAWLQPTAYAVATLLCSSLLGMIWTEAAGDPGWRIVGALAILLAALTLLVPLLRRMAPDEPPAAIASTAGATAAAAAPLQARHCPACGAALAQPSACGSCGARFSVEFRGA
ncbi:MAG: hypothetical protein ACKOSS_11105 [Planctomycetia bacterium]